MEEEAGLNTLFCPSLSHPPPLVSPFKKAGGGGGGSGTMGVGHELNSPITIHKKCNFSIVFSMSCPIHEL